MTDSTRDLKAISTRYFAAWEARDADAIVALHTEDTAFTSRLGMGPIRGREAVRDYFAELFVRFPELTAEIHRVLYGPDFWVLDWALAFRPEGSDETARFDCLDVVNVSPDGLVARKDTFVDMVQLKAALPELDVDAEVKAQAAVAA
jgi:uncharacterized protein (TIGR02246 family)